MAKGDLRCIDGRLFRHDPQFDDPDLETDIGQCPDCSGDGCSENGEALPTPMPSQDILDAVHSAYTRSCERQIEATAHAYQRQRDLPRIVAVYPDQLADISLKGREAIVSRLTKEAIAIARAGRDFPHHYERSRHIAILGALRAEKAQLAHLQNCAGLARIVEEAAA